MMNLMVEEETSQLGVGQLIDREERREEDDSTGDPELSRNLKVLSSEMDQAENRLIR